MIVALEKPRAVLLFDPARHVDMSALLIGTVQVCRTEGEFGERGPNYEVVKILDSHDLKGMAYQTQLEKLMEIFNTVQGLYGTAEIHVDVTGNEFMTDILREKTRFCRFYKFTGQGDQAVSFNGHFRMITKSIAVQKLLYAAEQGHIQVDARCPHAKEILKQLSQFQASPRVTGSIDYNAPAGQHDDFVSCLLLAMAVKPLTPVILSAGFRGMF